MAEILQFTPVYDDVTTKFLESEFARLEGQCYLDHAGATLYSDTQIKNVGIDLHRSLYANPHSIGIASSSTQDIVERTRYRILSHFNTNPEEYSVIFTSGATASLKIIAETFLFKASGNNGIGRKGNFVYVQDNHTSVLGMRDVVAARDVEVIYLDHDQAFHIFGQHSASRDSNDDDDEKTRNSNSLFVYSAQCNFSGLKYPLKWIKDVHTGALSTVTSNEPSTRWYVLLDAAGFAPTNNLDLSISKPDFVCLSFYKMFGYPTGIGALLVKNSSSDVLQKIYYGGGTVDVALSAEMFHVKHQVLYKRFEDGTIPFLSIASLQYGFDILSKFTMDKISKHVFSLAKILHHSLLMLHHRNGKPVVKLYSDTDYENRELQGGIVTFNLVRSNGEYVGYMEVVNMAALFKIHLRTGCFCNPGACQRHLSLSTKEIVKNYEAGYVCGGAIDLINGKPTGAVRISFGYMSTIKDVQQVLLMIRKCFVSGPNITKYPQWWEEYKMKAHKKYKQVYGSNVSDSIISCIVNDKNNITTDLPKHLCNENENLDCITSSTNTDRNVAQVNKCVLQRLFIYPIKSCGAYEITDSWNLNSKGLEYDREWLIMTSSGICLTQKHQIDLCLLRPVILKNEKIMKLTFPGMPTIEIPLENNLKTSMERPIYQSRVCESRVQGIDCGSEVSEWLSLALGKPNLRLIRQSGNGRHKKGLDNTELSFSSQAQYLIINEASVSWLIDKVSDTLDFKKDTAVHRFRGNVIVQGCDPFREMQWKSIRIGNNNFKVNGPCTRCQMICIDQTTGRKTIEPLRTLAEEFHGKLRFGVYLTRLENKQSVLKIGDHIYYS